MKNLLSLLPLLFAACGLDINLLEGQWQAIAFYENGQDAPAPLDSIAISFWADSHYEFRTIGFYREAGPFRVADSFLFLTDTTAKQPKERALKILFLSADTLKLQMERAGQGQVLFLKKI